MLITGRYSLHSNILCQVRDARRGLRQCLSIAADITDWCTNWSIWVWLFKFYCEPHPLPQWIKHMQLGRFIYRYWCSRLDQELCKTCCDMVCISLARTAPWSCTRICSTHCMPGFINKSLQACSNIPSLLAFGHLPFGNLVWFPCCNACNVLHILFWLSQPCCICHQVVIDGPA